MLAQQDKQAKWHHWHIKQVTVHAVHPVQKHFDLVGSPHIDWHKSREAIFFFSSEMMHLTSTRYFIGCYAPHSARNVDAKCQWCNLCFERCQNWRKCMQTVFFRLLGADHDSRQGLLKGKLIVLAFLLCQSTLLTSSPKKYFSSKGAWPHTAT